MKTYYEQDGIGTALAELDGTLREIRDVLRSIETKLASSAEARSSVEVKTSTRGVDVTTKAYTGSDIRPAGDAAIEEFLRVNAEITRRLMSGEH